MGNIFLWPWSQGHMSELRLYILNSENLLYVNYASVKLPKNRSVEVGKR